MEPWRERRGGRKRLCTYGAPRAAAEFEFAPSLGRPSVKATEIVTRAGAIVASLGGICAALWWSDAAQPAFAATIACVAIFYVLVHVVPGAIFPLQSMPYTYQLPNNFGRRGFELQNVTYAAYHTHWYNHATHAAFPVEACLWFVVAAHFGGALACAALALALAAQAISFGERRFALVLCAFWLTLAASASAMSAAFGATAYFAAQFGLVALGFWRFSGHWVEPLPPGVLGNRAFVALREAQLDWRLLRPMALGYLSEFSAGLPFRLVNSWLFVLAQRVGLEPERSLSADRARELAAVIHREGWSAHATTREIVAAARTLEPAPAGAAVDLGVHRGLTPVNKADAPAARASRIRLMACDRGASVWLLEIAGRTILFDAWLDDPYVSGSRSFFSAQRVERPVIEAEKLPPLDAIVLSSAEQDHCHPRTLARLDPRVPVFARREAARIAERTGFRDVTPLDAGSRAELFDGAVSLLALAGYGRNLAIVLRERDFGERVCLAQHGVNERWLARHEPAAFSREFARDAAGRLVDTVCLGVHTTLLQHRWLPAWLLRDSATIVPDPRDSARTIARLAPQRVLFSHCTPEAEQGFAVRHLLHYPTAADDVGYAARVLAGACPGVAIEGLPAPAAWI